MKKIFVLALMSLVVFAVSCGKEKEEEPKKEEPKQEEPKKEDEKPSIEGTWYLESSIVNGKQEKLDDCRKKTNVTFSAGKFKTNGYQIFSGKCSESIFEGTYAVSGNTITSQINGEEKSTATFTINENALTFSGKSSEGTDYVQVWKKR